MATLQSFNRGVRDLKMAKWTSPNVFGPSYDILGVRQANLSYVVETDEAGGDDSILDRYTRIVSAQLTIIAATLDLIPANMVLGGTLVSNAEYYDLTIGDSVDPFYIAVAGRVAGSNQGGDWQFLLPKAKLSASPQWNAQYGSYLFPQIQLQGVYEGPINNIMRMRHFFLPTTLTLPLAIAHD